MSSRGSEGGAGRSYRYVEAWGMTRGAYGRVFLPRNVEEIQEAMQAARASAHSIEVKPSQVSTASSGTVPRPSARISSPT